MNSALRNIMFFLIVSYGLMHSLAKVDLAGRTSGSESGGDDDSIQANIARAESAGHEQIARWQESSTTARKVIE